MGARSWQKTAHQIDLHHLVIVVGWVVLRYGATQVVGAEAVGCVAAHHQDLRCPAMHRHTHRSSSAGTTTTQGAGMTGVDASSGIARVGSKQSFDIRRVSF